MSKSVSDFVASSMDAVLKSAEHKTLFGNQYKFASDSNCAEDHEHDKEACGDSMDADDNDAKKKGKMPPWLKKDKEDKDSNDALDSDKFNLIQDESELPFEEKFPEAAAMISSKYPAAAKLLGLEDLDDKFPSTSHVLMDEGLETAAGFDIAIDSLLTASAALDSLGMEKTSTLSLKLASLVVEAKKKDKDTDKEKAAKEKAKEKAKKDAQAAKDKAAKEKEKAAKEKAKEKAKKDAQDAKDKAVKDKEKAAKEKEKEKAAKEKAAKEKSSKK